MSQNNNSQAFLIGRLAGDSIKNATKHGESGESRAAYALFLAIEEEVELVALVPGKDGEVERSLFTIEQLLLNPKPIREDGKEDTALQRARVEAVCVNLFSLGEADSAFKAKFGRACDTAVHLWNSLAAIEDDDEAMKARKAIGLVDRKRKRHGEIVQIAFLTVPMMMLFDPRDKALKLTDAQIDCYEGSLKYNCIELDGAKGQFVPETLRCSLNQLRARADVVAGKRSARSNSGVSPVKAFGDSLKFASKILDQWNGGAETDVAPTKALEEEMFNLANKLAAWFAANPPAADTEEEAAA